MILALAPAAFLAGILMFLAPCTLPLVPGYLAFIAGNPEGNLVPAAARRKMLLNAFFFVLGFSLVFIIVGSFAAFIGSHVGAWRPILGKGAGVLLIFFGLTMFGVFNDSFLSGQWNMRIPKALHLGRPESSFVIGVLFSLGWSPCIGPILGSILFIASATSTAAEGALLLLVFSVGISLPFLLCAYLMSEASRLIAPLSRVSLFLQKLGGSMLIIIGILMLGGYMGYLVTWGFGFFEQFGYSGLLNHL